MCIIALLCPIPTNERCSETRLVRSMLSELGDWNAAASSSAKWAQISCRLTDSTGCAQII